MAKTINLTGIIDYTAYACQQPRPVTNSACQVMLAHIAEHLSRGHIVQLNGFGRFSAVMDKGVQKVQFKPSQKLQTQVITDVPVLDDPDWPFSDWTAGGQ